MLVVQIIISSVITASHNSILYEITNDAIIVYSGILTRNKEHIPFRTITNIATRQGIIDRLLKIGTLEIHTAGTGVIEPEVELHGLENLETVYKLVAQKLKNTSYNSSQLTHNPSTGQHKYIKGINREGTATLPYKTIALLTPGCTSQLCYSALHCIT